MQVEKLRTREENIFSGKWSDSILMAEAELIPGLRFQPRALLTRECQVEHIPSFQDGFASSKSHTKTVGPRLG